jgi:hypothetical protein
MGITIQINYKKFWKPTHETFEAVSVNEGFLKK